MIVRSLWRCTGNAAPRLRFLQAKPRRFSSSAAATPSPPPSQTAMLATFTNDFDRIAPRFEVNGSQIQVLRSPAEFYESLKNKILSAERQIFLSTLYIGKTEHELISTIQTALRAKPNLKLSILTDALRGTREAPSLSCASLLAPLVTEFGPERVDIRMYHTPNLTGLRKKYIPLRINEGWGLQHMKLYGVDDEIIISGANLSTDYFTNRQDRYHLFSSKEITQYFFGIHQAVAGLSFVVAPSAQLPAGFSLEWPSSNSAPSPLVDHTKYMAASKAILSPLIAPKALANTLPENSKNTLVYPISQLTPLLSSSTELPLVTNLLTTLTLPEFSTSSWTFTAGYFNPSPPLTRLLLSTTSSNNTILTASPQANGFYGSSGVSGLLPAAYTLLARRFLLSASRSPHHANSTVLKEWKRGMVGVGDGWTYHAKGLWVSLNGEKEPSITIVGSSNYTQRSYSLDLEAGVAIVTSDAKLKKELAEERDGLQDYAVQVGMDDFLKVERRVGVRVRIAMWIVGLVGGAL